MPASFPDSTEGLSRRFPPEHGRRGFLKGAVATVLGGAALLVPPLAGLRVLVQPLRRSDRPGLWTRVTVWSALPEDGSPRRFPIVADRVNAWTRLRETPIGAVYVRRSGPEVAEAFNVVCPHAGCLVDYAASHREFLCPCHNSSFGIDGRVLDPASPSPRGLDRLETEVRPGGEVWVQFQQFRTGIPEKIPLA